VRLNTLEALAVNPRRGHEHLTPWVMRTHLGDVSFKTSEPVDCPQGGVALRHVASP